MEKTKGKNLYSTKRLLYSICFACLMGIDAVVGSQSEFIFMFTNNMVGVVVAIILFSAYKPKDFLRPFYIVWSIFGLTFTVLGYFFWLYHQVGYMLAKCITIPLNVWILGLVVFILFKKALITKDVNISISFAEFTFLLCMILLTLSKNESVWPIYYGLIFLTLHHTPFSENDKCDLLHGSLNGIILGFFLIQCFAFYNRPYDVVRYVGAYGDCNRNGCMYLVTICALLSKSFLSRIEVKKNGYNNTLHYLVYIFFHVLSAGVFVFLLFTGCRSAIVGLIFLWLFYIFLELKIVKEKIYCIILRIIICLVLLIPAIPIVYALIRYVPAICDHPLYYSAEWNEEKVQPRSPINDARYVSIEEAVDMICDRFFLPDNIAIEANKVLGNDFFNPFVMRTFAADFSSLEVSDEYSDVYEITYWEIDATDPERLSFYAPKIIYTGNHTVDVRINIALVLLRNINFSGHKSSDGRYMIISDNPNANWVISQNPQNFVIYMLYSYGIVCGGVGITLYFAGLLMMIYKALKGNIYAIVASFFYLIHFGMGITEVTWIPGQIILVMLFFTVMINNTNSMLILDTKAIYKKNFPREKTQAE